MNNGQKRRAVRDAQAPRGVKVVYNEDQPRAEKRKLMGTMIKCQACKERMLFKNLTEHVRKAALHQDMYKEFKKQDLL